MVDRCNRMIERNLKDAGTIVDKGKVAMDPNRGFNSLYIYCDVAEAMPVDDNKAPLLRVVDAAGNFGDLIHRLYTTPLYVPVSRKEFNTVEQDIRNDTERPMPFEFGKVVVTLQLNRSRNPYFLS